MEKWLRRLRAALVAGATAPALAGPAPAGELADKAALAESLLTRGYAASALSAYDSATAAFWAASPLQLRVAVFADEVAGYADYTPRASADFRPGETMRVYLEPVGFAFTPDGDAVRAEIAVDVTIRTPGGLVLGSAEDFVKLAWSGRTPIREAHASIATPLPFLKPGDYQLALTLRDQGSAKTATLTLPFAMVE